MVQIMEDYTLLRAFDLKKANEGDPICTSNGTLCQLIGCIEGSQEYPVVVSIPSNTDGKISLGRFTKEGRSDKQTDSSIYMSPLFWCQGKPVYYGDILYDIENGNTRRWQVLSLRGKVSLKHGDKSYPLSKKPQKLYSFFWEQPKTLSMPTAKGIYSALEALNSISSKVSSLVLYAPGRVNLTIKINEEEQISIYKDDLWGVSSPIEIYNSYLEFAKAYGFV